MAPTVAQALDAYLAPRVIRPDGLTFESSFAALLRDARQATSRDDTTGALPRRRAYEGRSWLGALGYLCLIDQVGTAVRPKRTTKIPLSQREPTSFMRCLRRFSRSRCH